MNKELNQRCEFYGYAVITIYGYGVIYGLIYT